MSPTVASATYCQSRAVESQHRRRAVQVLAALTILSVLAGLGAVVWMASTMWR